MAKPDRVQSTINSLIKLGESLHVFLEQNKLDDPIFEDELHQELALHVQNAKHHNAWFTEDEVLFCLNSWSKALTENNLNEWLKDYNFKDTEPKLVGLVLAGNVPLVGLHDIICVLISGHHVIAKYSSKDKLLIHWVAKFLIREDASFTSRILLTESQLKNFDAVIATGSNNTARYFEYYFRKKPNIIRKNRNSIAVLSGKETQEDFANLAEDIFRYFGLGCRSVSKLMVPKGYNFTSFYEGIFHKQTVLQHDKYTNNYDYNKAVYLMSSVKLFDNNFVILKEDQSLSSPIGCLFYEFYEDQQSLESWITHNEEKLQCVVGNQDFSPKINVAFGQSQHPQLWDYADGIDTLDFLLKL